MDQQERRYFQLKVGTYRKKEGTLVYQLFQQLIKADHYDEEKIRQSVCGEDPGRQFQVLKNQLYHQVLDTLIQIRKESTVPDRIRRLIQKSCILQEKKLYREADKFLERATKIAICHDQFEQLLEIYKFQKTLYAWILEVDKRAEHIARFWEKEKEVLSQLSNLRTLEWLSMRIFDLYYRNHYAKNDQEKRQFEQLMDHPLLKHEQAALSFSAKVVFLNTHGLYEDAIGQKEKCLRYRKKLLALYQAHPDRLKEHFPQYLAAFNNYILALVHEEQFPEAVSALDILEQLPVSLKRKMKSAEKVMWFRAYYSLLLELTIRLGDFAAALDLIPLLNQRFEELDKDLNIVFRFPFYYFFAYANFALGRFDQALEQLEPLIFQVELQFKQELFRFARLLQLIIHFEKGDYEYLTALIRSTRRYLRRLGGTYLLEDLLLRFLAKAPFSNSKIAFRQLHDDLQQKEDQLLTPHVLHHLDLRAWAQAHCENRSFVDIYQEIRQ